MSTHIERAVDAAESISDIGDDAFERLWKMRKRQRQRSRRRRVRAYALREACTHNPHPCPDCTADIDAELDRRGIT